MLIYTTNPWQVVMGWKKVFDSNNGPFSKFIQHNDLISVW